jgi:hypothetical protein
MIDARLMMLPPRPCPVIQRAAARLENSTPYRLMSMTR